MTDKQFEKSCRRLAKHNDQSRRRSLDVPVKWPPPDTLIRPFEEDGLRCVVCRGNVSLCGYVHVPYGHPSCNSYYDDVDVNVHGGLTFCQRDLDGGMWFGFDTGHLGDWVALSHHDH